MYSTTSAQPIRWVAVPVSDSAQLQVCAVRQSPIGVHLQSLFASNPWDKLSVVPKSLLPYIQIYPRSFLIWYGTCRQVLSTHFTTSYPLSTSINLILHQTGCLHQHSISSTSSPSRSNHHHPESSSPPSSPTLLWAHQATQLSSSQHASAAHWHLPLLFSTLLKPPLLPLDLPSQQRNSSSSSLVCLEVANLPPPQTLLLPSMVQISPARLMRTTSISSTLYASPWEWRSYSRTSASPWAGSKRTT